MSIIRPTILSLYDRSGVWSEPYAKAGCKVIRVDKEFGMDARILEYANYNDSGIYGILAAPPCTHLASSGARWWKQKGEKALLDSLALVDCVLRYVVLYKPIFWCIENPIGRLVKYLGPPRMTFNPCAFGDPWTKKTCLWGKFRKPRVRLVEPVEGSIAHRLSSRDFRRAETPRGFARAFFEKNPPRFQRL